MTETPRNPDGADAGLLRRLRDLAHDLNNQLFVIHGNAELLKRESLPESAADILEEVARAADRARQIGDDMRTLCRQASGEG